ncbi:hypothetical protein ES703_97839 [subsurface metagenome]
MLQQAHIGGTLYIGGSSQGIDAAAGNTHIRQQKLEYGVRPYVLGAVCVLGSSHGVHNRTGFALLAGSRIGAADLKVNIFWRPGDVADRIRIIS